MDILEIRKAFEEQLLCGINELFNENILNKIIVDNKGPLYKLIKDGAVEYKTHTNSSNIEHHKLQQINTFFQEIINKKDKKWINWIEHSLNKYFDTNAQIYQKSAIVGEIYSASIIYSATHKGEPIPEQRGKGKENIQTPVFKFNFIKNNTVFFEVNTPTINTDEKERIKKIEQVFEEKVRTKPEPVMSCLIEISAAGNNPKFSTYAENCINKFSNIKAFKKQLKAGDYNVLVVSLIDDDFCLFPTEQLCYIHNGPWGSLSTGSIWQAFYGKENDKVLEGYIGNGNIPTMKFSGMFERNDKNNISAALIILPYKVVLYENHNAINPLPKEVLMSLINMHDFDLNISEIRIPYSYFTDLEFKNKIKKQRKIINSITKNDLCGYV